MTESFSSKPVSVGSEANKLRFTQLRVHEGRIPVRIISEPYVVLTLRGYAPVVDVFELHEKVKYSLYIQAKSLAEKLEVLRNDNKGLFAGLEFIVSKASTDKFSLYVVESIT